MPYDFVNRGFTKSHTSLDDILSLGNRITYEIAYDFRRDRTTAQLCSCRHNTTAVASRHATAEVKCKEKG